MTGHTFKQQLTGGYDTISLPAMGIKRFLVKSFASASSLLLKFQASEDPISLDSADIYDSGMMDEARSLTPLVKGTNATYVDGEYWV